MIINELLSKLGLKVDQSSFRRGQAGIDGVTKGLQKQGKALSDGTRSLAKYAAGYMSFRAVKAVVKDALAFDDALVDMQVSSQHTVGSMDSLRDKIYEVSAATGTAKEQVAAIARTFVSLTGDGAAGVKAMEPLTKIAVATAADTQDIARAAAALNMHLGITPDKMESAFSVISEAGKRGQVELKDFAGLFAETGASFKQFGNSQSIRGLTSVASGLQFVAQNFGGPTEAATGLNQLMGVLPKRFEALKKAGVDIFDDNGNLREFSSIIFEIADLNLNQAELTNLIGGRQEAKLALMALMDNRDAWMEQARAIEKADSIQQDYNDRTASAGHKIRKSLNETKNNISALFDTDVLQKFASGLEGVIGTLMQIPAAIDDASDSLYRAMDAMAQFFGIGKDTQTEAHVDKRNKLRKDIERFGGPGSPMAQPLMMQFEALGGDPSTLMSNEKLAKHRWRQAKVSGAHAASIEAGFASPATLGTGSRMMRQSPGVNTTINVQPGPGMDEEMLARKVADHVSQANSVLLRDVAASEGVR